VDDTFGDLDGQGTCDVPQPLAANSGSYSCSITVNLAADDLAPHTNVVTASASDDDGNTDTDEDDETVTFTDVAPEIALTKSASPTSVPETGGDVIFTFTVENTGQEDVTLTSLTDNKFGDLDGQGTCSVPQSILIGGSYSCSITVNLAADDLADHVNVATAKAEDDEGTPAEDSDDEKVTFDDVLPNISVLKTADPTSVPETGGDVTFTFKVTNNGLEAATIDSLSDTVFDPLAGDADCQVGTVLAGGGFCEFSITRTISGDYAGGFGRHQNTVTVTASDNDGNSDEAKDDADVIFTDVKPDISVLKTANPTSVPEPGGNVTFEVVVTNNSAEPATLDSLTDSIHGNLAGQGTCATGAALAANGGTYTCSFSAAVNGDAGYAETDVVTATASDNDGNSGTATDDATVTVTDVKPAIRVIKDVTPSSLIFTGGTVTYKVTVYNDSVEPVTLTALVDDKFGNLNGQGTCSTPQTIVVGGSYSCTFTKVLVGELNANGLGYKPHTNTVTATANDNENNTTTASDNATVSFFWRGRTPGYWKNHASEWPKFSIVNHNGATVQVTPNTKVRDVFNVPTSYTCIKSTDTLLTALGYGGGNTVCAAAQILLRAATAALLNEQFFGAAYPAYNSVSELITAVNQALASQNRTTMINLANKLDYWNNGVH
jgi:uncharacterized repeat protein (TIGR01451 family)